jgi:two-component system sensor histidine kinase EvgS
VLSEQSWGKTLEKIRDKEIDMVSSIVQTPKRLKHMIFTDSFYTPPNSIYTRKDALSISSLSDLHGKKIAVENQYYLQERLAEKHPKIQLLIVNTTVDALKALSQGDVDAYIGNQAAANWLAEKYALTNLKISHVDDEINTAPLRFSVRKDWSIFQGILNKALASIPDAELIALRHKWMGINTTTKTLSLSSEEQQWLDSHKTILFAGDPNWLPYEAFDKQGNYIGIVADHLNLIEKKLGINIERIPTDTWSESVEKIKQGEVDILSESTDSELKSSLTFTQSYLSSPIVIIMKNNNNYIEQIDQIKKKKIAVIKDYGYVPAIIKKHPDINFHVVNTIQDGLTAVSTGKVDALFATLSQASYHISDLGIHNIRIVGKTEFTTRLAFGMRKEFAPLIPLFNRALSTISKGEKQNILNTWGKEKYATKIDYSLLIKLAAALLFIIATILFWNRKLSKEMQKRKELEAQTQALIEAIPLQILVTSYDGSILSANPKALSENNINEEDIQKLNIQEFYAESVDRQTLLKELSTEGKIDQKVLPFKMLDGEIRSMMISMMPVFYRNQKSLITVSLDVTERMEIEASLKKATESAEAASHFKSQFLANMSHEIRTPMNAIIGLGHLLSRTSLDTKQLGYVDKMGDSAQSLLGIIDDILDFSKIEAGQLNIETIEFNLDDVLNNLTTLISTRIKDKPLEYIYQIDTNIPANLIGDPYRLGQVLTNLVGNAIKFTEQGHILLSITILQQEPFLLQFSVEDTGAGIPTEKIGGLFEPFTQADGSTTRNYGGTGLGLSICHQLTELMGGKVSATSQLGKGSRFEFILPFQVSKKMLLPKSTTDLQGLRVLLVDDNPTTLKALSEMLTSLTFKVDPVSSGLDALKTLSEANNSYDLILLDWRMPQLDGIETAKRIRTEFSNKSPAIILMTAFGREAVEQKIDREHLDSFLVKPITPSQILDAFADTMNMNMNKTGTRSGVYDVPGSPSIPLLTGQILLAEDNPINQQVAQEILEQMGLEVEICKNGLEAVASVRKRRPDLVIMDIQMPLMDGFEATNQIRQIEGMETLPIIAMTANAMVGDAERSLRSGMNDHIAKPVDPILLYETVKSWLEKIPEKYQKPPADKNDKKTWEKNLLGMDLQQGLKHIGGNQDLYIKLLRDFLISHAESAKRLDQYLSDNNLKAAQRLAHTIRGTAGTLGATQLEEAAHKIDNSLRGNNSVSAERLNALNQASDELFRSLAEWLPKQGET